MRCYSQNAEQAYILQICPEPTGKFLDIGAFHPTIFSNTRALYERGWSGLMIEPSPVPFSNLAMEYMDSERVKVLNAAVILDSYRTDVELWVTDDAVSTTEPSHYELWKNDAKFTGQVDVPATSLDRIYAEHGPFDFVSIDTEGTSVDLFKQLLQMGARPKCICVEFDGRTEEALHAAANAGYMCMYSSSENLVFMRRTD